MTKAKQMILTGKELRKAQSNHLKIRCEERFYSPWEKDMDRDCYAEEVFCHFTSRLILPQDFREDEVAEIEFEEGYISLYAIEGIEYA